MITFNTWADCENYHLKEVPVKGGCRYFGLAEGLLGRLEALEEIYCECWVEENYNHNPTFTVKEQDSTDSSDSYDRLTIHQQ